MNERGMIYIVSPDMAYSKRVDYPLSHLDLIQEYCDKMKLGYNFKNSDYQEAPVRLALDGNMVVKTVDDLGDVIFYLPKYICDEQAMWFYNNRDKFKNYSVVSAYVIDSKRDEYRTVDDLSNIKKYIDKANILWSKEEVNRRR